MRFGNLKRASGFILQIREISNKKAHRLKWAATVVRSCRRGRDAAAFLSLVRGALLVAVVLLWRAHLFAMAHFVTFYGWRGISYGIEINAMALSHFFHCLGR